MRTFQECLYLILFHCLATLEDISRLKQMHKMCKLLVPIIEDRKCTRHHSAWLLGYRTVRAPYRVCTSNVHNSPSRRIITRSDGCWTWQMHWKNRTVAAPSIWIPLWRCTLLWRQKPGRGCLIFTTFGRHRWHIPKRTTFQGSQWSM